MNEPLINIISRCSRLDKFKNCYNSIRSQTYTNYRHIITFETDQIKEWLEEFVDSQTVLVRVPNKKQLKHHDTGRMLQLSYNYNACTDDFVDPDYDFMDLRIEHDIPWENGGYRGTWPKINLPVPTEKQYPGCLGVTYREYFRHFPYNLYLKIAEKEFKEGWVVYLDDDDVYSENTTLEKVVNEINKFGEDTLHIFPFVYPNGDELPNTHYRNMYRLNHPFVRHQISGSHLCFHTKYAEYTQWDEWGAADYRTAKALEKVIPNKNITDFVWIKLIMGTNGGANIK